MILLKLNKIKIMINEKLIDSFLKNVEKECLIRGMKEIFNHLKIQSSYEYDNLIYDNIDIIGFYKLITIDEIDI